MLTDNSPTLSSEKWPIDVTISECTLNHRTLPAVRTEKGSTALGSFFSSTNTFTVATRPWLHDSRKRLRQVECKPPPISSGLPVLRQR